MHNFKYTLKALFQNKMLIFWTFIFPIVLGTFFSLAFSDIEKKEKLDIINIAIVENEQFNNNELFKETFKVLSDKNSDKQLFNTKYLSEDQAKKKLEKNEIVGYLKITDIPQVVINKNGIDETVLKYVTDEVSQSQIIINKVIENKVKGADVAIKTDNTDWYAGIYNEALEIINQDKVNIVDVSSNKLSYTMIEFYTLIAMACLYGGILGMVALNQNLPNMSNNGKRVAVSPIPKSRLIFSSVSASYITQLIGIALLFIYTIFVLNVDYGENIGLVILLAVVGCLSGLTLGIAIATLFKTSDNVKTGIVISLTMLGCFLAGMMGITMKYIIDKNLPIINKLNPASMITDGFYSLYYYDTLDRFYLDIISLLIFSIVMICISVLSLRRQKYDSI